MPYTTSTAAKTVLLFDSQFTNYTVKAANELRASLLNSPNYAWILDIVAKFPETWRLATKAIPKLQSNQASALVDEFVAWLRGADFQQITFPLPNILLTPITVITELVQYTKYLESQGLKVEDAPNKGISTLGFCTGLLSAFAVSSSASQSDLEQFGAVALRIALLVGAVVDKQNESGSEHSNWTSVSVGWSSPDGKSQLDTILKKFPEVLPHIVFFSIFQIQCKAPIY